MDRGKAIMWAGLAVYVVAVACFLACTAALSSGWYAFTATDSGTTLKYDFGALRYSLALSGRRTGEFVCEYVGNPNRSATADHPCQDIPSMLAAGQFALADVVLTWLSLLPAMALLLAYAAFRPLPRIIKLSWVLGVVSCFWSAWAWLVYAIKFSATRASPSWAWTLAFLGFLLATIAQALSIIGAKAVSRGYEVMGPPDDDPQLLSRDPIDAQHDP